MAAPLLQRSVDTFRRSGSSGLVWEDRFVSEDLSRLQGTSKTRMAGPDEWRGLRQSHSVGTIGQMDRSGRTISGGGGGGGGGGGTRPYQSSSTMASRVVDPPSPKLPVCRFFGLLGNSAGTKKITSKPGKR